MDNIAKPSLSDLITIKKMKQYQRYPIPEALMPHKGNFKLRIDSILIESYRVESMKEWAKYRPDTTAPYNSMNTEDELQIY